MDNHCGRSQSSLDKLEHITCAQPLNNRLAIAERESKVDILSRMIRSRFVPNQSSVVYQHWRSAWLTKFNIKEHIRLAPATRLCGRGRKCWKISQKISRDDYLPW